jgi:hypothetical protein
MVADYTKELLKKRTAAIVQKRNRPKARKQFKFNQQTNGSLAANRLQRRGAFSSLKLASRRFNSRTDIPVK